MSWRDHRRYSERGLLEPHYRFWTDGLGRHRGGFWIGDRWHTPRPGLTRITRNPCEVGKREA